MTPDVPIVLSFIYAFITLNFFGWGILKDQRFIFFGLVTSFLYLIAAFLIKEKRWSAVVRTVLLLSFIAVSVFGVTADIMYRRHITSVEGFINDSGLQSEIAGRFLLLGKNPYTETYEKTDLAKAPYIDETGNTLNPALRHNAYPPLFLIFSALGFRIFSQTVRWFDIRVLSLLFYASVIAWGAYKFRVSESFILFLALFGMNPMFVSYLIQGSNDIAVLSFILWSLVLLERKRWIWGGILLGLAIATKQIAWIAAPLFVWYVWQHAARRNFWRFVAGAVTTAGLIYAPFIMWDAPSVWENLVLYVNGSIPTSYPIHNFGLGMFLVRMWIIPSIYAYYPFWIWQVGIIALVFGVWWLTRRKKKISAGQVMAAFVVALAITSLFNRFMNFSYLGAIAGLAGVAVVWYDKS